ncbi:MULTISPECIES: hypothetical protein [Paenibacillus]|uniref:Uncharacterized protein n=2 Tax=Paenibacillus TaxID=44249 RepID=A0ABX2ZB90_PAEPO|nr:MULTISPECIES: hypothetical protein [Paenibacillus]MDR6779511.1 hypothetical protein [Paenibacillus peoriae]ODA08222.1 hypothetical protein A7312_27845 [Paenibacillus polymyxa]
MIKNRYTIKKDNDYYYVYMEGIRKRDDYRIPIPMKTELEAIILANCLESEYRAGFIEGTRSESNK